MIWATSIRCCAVCAPDLIVLHRLLNSRNTDVDPSISTMIGREGNTFHLWKFSCSCALKIAISFPAKSRGKSGPCKPGRRKQQAGSAEIWAQMSLTRSTICSTCLCNVNLNGWRLKTPLFWKFEALSSWKRSRLSYALWIIKWIVSLSPYQHTML